MHIGEIDIGDSLALLTLVSSIITHLLLLNCKGLPAHGACAAPEQEMRNDAENGDDEKVIQVSNLASQPWRQAVWQACCLDALHPGRSSCEKNPFSKASTSLQQRK